MPLKANAVAKAMLPLPPKANGCCKMHNEREKNDNVKAIANHSPVRVV